MTTTARDLQLYVKDDCPYCHKVLDFMASVGIKLPLRNISSDPDARAYLIEHGGKRQVPCLFVDGEALYESDAIIAYLGRAFGQVASADAATSSHDEGAAPQGGACSIDGAGCHA